MQGKRHQRQTGTILFLAIVFTVVCGYAIGHAVNTAVLQAKSSQNLLDQITALALAEGVLAGAQVSVLQAAADYEVPRSGAVALAAQTYSYSVTPEGVPFVRVDANGFSQAIQVYRIVAGVEVGSAGSTLERLVEVSSSNIFDYMIFYDGDMEIQPGRPMLLAGPIHANGSIYLNGVPGRPITVDSNYLRASEKIIRGEKDGSLPRGTIDIRVSGGSTFENMPPGQDSNHPNWHDLALTRWNGTVQSGVHGVTDLAVPEIGTIKAYDSDGNPGFYHENADLVIIDGVPYSGGAPIVLPPGTLIEESMYDAREGVYVTNTKVDIGLLNSSGYFPANGLLYAYRSDASSTQPNGIQLTNGAELAGSLTVVTENPIYIQGDYNTVNKKSAAVISDAVNLLSNAWDNSKAPGSLTNAVDTQYNLAMVTGDVPTDDDGVNYSGGFENLPRFHEYWRNRSATIRGSFIKIFESEYAKGLFYHGGDVYTAPIRDWQYDPDIIPPFSPQVVSLRKVFWNDNLPLPFGNGI